MWGWIKLLRRINDEKMHLICGTDVALYLVYLRYSAYFFLLVSLINVFNVMMYLTGDPDVENLIDQTTVYSKSFSRKITILNISASPWKVTVIFFICFVVVSRLVVYFIFIYMIKFQEFEQKDIGPVIEDLEEDSLTDKFQELDEDDLTYD